MRARRRNLQTSFLYYAIGVLLLAVLVMPTAVLAESKRLDITSLKELLVNLGYEPEEKKFDDGEKYFLIRPKVQGRTWYVTARTPSGRNMYVQMKFVKIEDTSKIPQDVAVGLLKENGNTSYSSFFLSKWGYFYLTANIQNKDVKPAEIRKAIEEMTTLAAKTEDFWNPKRWTKQPAGNTPKAEKKEPKPDETKKAQ